ncbi:LPS export ABC transporter periplasmic protein LptC [Spirochaeta dissipatitropha]
MNRYFWTGALIILLLFTAACSLEYDMLETDEDSEFPELELFEIRHVVARSGRTQLMVEAQYSGLFQSQSRQILRNVYFYEFDSQGNIASEGSADSANVFLDIEDIEFQGSIFIYSHEDEAGVEADYLRWSNEDRQLQGRDGEEVRIRRDDGSEIQGDGFLADMRSRSLVFSDRVEGTFVDSPEESGDDSDNGEQEREES